MQAVNDQIQAAGATLVAITPHLPDYSKEMIERHKLSFDLLSDPGNEYAAELGIRFRVPDYIEAIYKNILKNQLPEKNGDGSWTLPMPGRFAIDKGGIVRAVDVDPDYTHRPEPEKTIADLAALG